MTDIASSPTPATSLPELSGRMADDLAHLDAELAEVDLLVVQAKTEAARHESRRVAAAEKLATAISTATSSGAPLDPTVVGGPQRPARPADQARGVDGIAGRRPRGQATGPRPVSRCARRVCRVAEPVPGRAHPGGASGQDRRRRPSDRGHERRPAGRLPPAARRPGGPPSRDRPGDARRPRPEPDQHRPPGPDRRAPGRPDPAQAPATRSASSSRWSSRRSRRPRRSSSTSGRWSSTTSGSCRPCVARHASAAGAPACRSTSTRSAPDRRLPMDLESGLFRILDEAMSGLPVRASANGSSIRLDWSDQVEASRLRIARRRPRSRPDPTPDGRPPTRTCRPRSPR